MRYLASIFIFMCGYIILFHLNMPWLAIFVFLALGFINGMITEQELTAKKKVHHEEDFPPYQSDSYEED